MSTASLGGQAQGGGSEEAVTLPFPLQPECGLGAGKEEVGGTEEACPLGEGASGQQLPVWFQAGGPAHLMTEEPFMGLGSRDRGRAGHGGYSGEGCQRACMWQSGRRANTCMSKSDGAVESQVPPHAILEMRKPRPREEKGGV